jgi:hypothetical protein
VGERAAVTLTGLVAFGGSLLGAFLIALAHALRPELGVCSASLSTYFAGRTRLVMFAAYAALGAALVANAMDALAGPGLASLTAGFLLLVAGIGLVPIGLTARTELGDLDTRSARAIAWHWTLAVVTFVAAVGGMVADVIGGRTSLAPGWLGVGLALAASLALVIALFSRPGPTYGLRQKVLLLLIVVFMAWRGALITPWPAGTG